MVRKSLEHESIPPEYQLRNMWRATIIIRVGGESYGLRVVVWGAPTNVKSDSKINKAATDAHSASNPALIAAAAIAGVGIVGIIVRLLLFKR